MKFSNSIYDYRYAILFSCLIIFVIIVCIFAFEDSSAVKEDEPQNIESIKERNERSLQDSIYTYIVKIGIEHADVVFAQCLLETGNLKSASFLKAHNCFGMKMASQRPTLAIGVYLGHAEFRSWKESVIDFLIWQNIYARNLTRDAYMKYIDRVYSENKSYVKIINQILKRMDKPMPEVITYVDEVMQEN